MAVTPFPDSPRNGGLGDRPYAIIDWQGPNPYVVIATGNPPTGGQPISPGAFGLSAPVEAIIPVGLSSSGTYYVYAVQLTSYNQGQGNATWALMWITAATGAQAGGINLSAEVIRLIAFGPY
jgi:hypothetical protein